MSSFFPQTQQGADIIASALKATVYMPDFFDPKGSYPIERFPPKNDQDKHDLQDFFGGTASPSVAIQKLTNFGMALRADGARNVAAYGFCWGIYLYINPRRTHNFDVGGKVTLSSGGSSTPFDAVAIVHPA